MLSVRHTLVIGVTLLCNPWVRAGISPAISNERRIFRIVTANLNFENPRATQVAKTLRAKNPDVLVVLEWTGKNMLLDPFLKQGYRAVLNEPRPGTHGICILMKEEAAQGALIPSPMAGPCRIPIGVVRFQWGGKPYALLGVHTPPPVPACQNTTAPTVRALGNLIEDGKLREPFGVGRPGDPVFLVGDLNSPSFTSAIRGLSFTGLTNYHQKNSAAS